MLFPVWVPPDMGPPTDFALKMKPLLCTILVVQALLSVCRFIIGDIVGGLCDVASVVVGYMAVQEMSTSLLFLYFVLNAFNCIFDSLYALTRLFQLGWNYFDPNMPFLFNLASFTLPACAVMSATGALVSYKIYADQRDRMNDQVPFAQFNDQQGERIGFYGGMGGGDAPPRPAPPERVQVFGGTGHRLGEGPEPAAAGQQTGPDDGPAGGQPGQPGQGDGRV